MIYTLLKSGNEDKIAVKNSYSKVILDKLKQCHKEPEIDIILTKEYGDVTVVVYTDTIDSIVQENKSLNAQHNV